MIPGNNDFCISETRTFFFPRSTLTLLMLYPVMLKLYYITHLKHTSYANCKTWTQRHLALRVRPPEKTTNRTFSMIIKLTSIKRLLYGFLLYKPASNTLNLQDIVAKIQFLESNSFIVIKTQGVCVGDDTTNTC